LAYHEAGHAVMAWVCGVRVEKVTIVRDSWSLGRVVPERLSLSRTDSWDWEDWETFMYKDREPKGTPSLKEVERNLDAMIMFSLAGGIAARRYDPRGQDYARGDREDTRRIVRSYVTVSEEHGEAYVGRLTARAAAILEEHWHLVKALAEKLVRKRTLDGDEAAKFLESVAQHHIARKRPLVWGRVEI
jgi:hypothetical protein